MKKWIFPIAAVFLIWLGGCASSVDLKKTQRDYDSKMSSQQGDVEKLQARFDQFEKNYTQTMRDVRNNQANFGADLGAVRDDVRTLRGQMEQMNREVSATGRGQNMKNRLDDLDVRIANIEHSMGIGKKEPGGQRPEAAGTEPSAEPKTDPKDAYNACYKVFKDGQYAKAREQFQKFLKQYPKTAYSDNAQYWIGETWYVEEKYEKAIVEYEKVIKGFPTGDAVPYALLKQGMSFQKLGDKASAKIVYQQIVKKYPQTNQAKVARARLSELK
ncbi:MAG TPA: tol-pal system protein YbgF [Syntrophales bacterium]|nr:tol-pal system protein YbgF [Syntrophales bacterium]